MTDQIGREKRLNNFVCKAYYSAGSIVKYLGGGNSKSVQTS